MLRKSIGASPVNVCFAPLTDSAWLWRLEKFSASWGQMGPERVPRYTLPWVLCDPRAAMAVCWESVLVIRAPAAELGFSLKALLSITAVPNAWFAFTGHSTGWGELILRSEHGRHWKSWA